MARIEHDRADAYDAARTLLALKQRQYLRRWKAAAEAHIDQAYAEASLNAGVSFDAEAVATEAIRVATSQHLLESEGYED